MLNSKVEINQSLNIAIVLLDLQFSIEEEALVNLSQENSGKKDGNNFDHLCYG